MQQEALYTFDYTQDRLDVAVVEALANKEEMWAAYCKLIEGLKNPDEQTQTLNSIRGLHRVSDSTNSLASKNIIDYYFESAVLTSMGGEQLERYISHIEQCFAFTSVTGLGDVGPIWVDTVHHCCVYSVLTRLGHHVITMGRIDHIVLLLRPDIGDPRLEVLKSYIASVYGVTLEFVYLSDKWMRQLNNIITDSTLCVSMCDMPNEIYSRRINKVTAKQIESNYLKLYYDDMNSISVECITDYSTLARRLRANHVVLDYPTEREVQIRPYDPDVAPSCPIGSWVFWPRLSGLDTAIV